MASPSRPGLLQRLSRIHDPAALREWAEQPGHSSLNRFLLRQLQVFVLTARNIIREEITLRAAALTYNTILSIVPMLAVGFALFKAFGGLRKLEGPLRNLMLENLAVGRAEEVGRWLDQVISNISAGAIAGFGVILLFYSAIGLLTNIESSINRIWGIERGRPLFVRFAIYWCLITLAPPLLGFSISISTRLQSSAFAMSVLSWLPFGLGRWVLGLSSAFGVCLAFTMVYLLVPATKVRFKPAMLGGVVAGLLWSISKYVFVTVSAGTLKYSAVYGALGVLPLLMLWIYVSWIIVLFGATFAHANQAVRISEQEGPAPRLAQAQRELLAVRLAVAVAVRFRAGGRPPGVEALADAVEAPLTLVRELLEVLVAHDLLLEVGSGESESGYVPARDPQEISAAQVIEVLRHRDGASLPGAGEGSLVGNLLEEAERSAAEVLRSSDLRSLAIGAEAQAPGRESAAASQG
jgi:membrane protein